MTFTVYCYDGRLEQTSQRNLCIVLAATWRTASKKQFVLFADRVSAATIRANQLRLYLSVMAYSLVCGLRRLGLRGTQLAHAQVGTIRLRLLKIGAQIRVTVRKVWVHPTFSLIFEGVSRLFGYLAAKVALDYAK